MHFRRRTTTAVAAALAPTTAAPHATPDITIVTDTGDETVDIIIASFLVNYNLGRIPDTNFANHCNTTFPGTHLHYCASIANGIRYCQRRGKKVLLSLGGAEGSYGFQDDQSAIQFARLLWDMFLGGNHPMRPFGEVVLDGIDLDLEHGGPTGVTAFSRELRRLYQSTRYRKYLLTAAPQCEFPDSNLGRPLEEAWFDMVFIQFYNNWCGLMNFDNVWAWNYPVWDKLRRRMPNPNTKLYLGAPASPGAGRGYVNLSRLTQIYKNVSSTYEGLGGIMLWDASNAWNNYNLEYIDDGRVQRSRNPGGMNFAQATGQWLHNQRRCFGGSNPTLGKGNDEGFQIEGPPPRQNIGKGNNDGVQIEGPPPRQNTSQSNNGGAQIEGSPTNNNIGMGMGNGGGAQIDGPPTNNNIDDMANSEGDADSDVDEFGQQVNVLDSESEGEFEGADIDGDESDNNFADISEFEG